MNDCVIILLLVNSAALLLIPRRWTPLPLLIGAIYITSGQALQLGPLHFSAVRILIGVGFVRAFVRGERLTGQLNALDWLMLVWALWAVICSLFYNEFYPVLINRLGLAYDACGIYFLLRVFCQSLDDIIRMSRIIAILLLPIALEMSYEKLTGHNMIYEMVGSHLELDVRQGRVRAQGSFAHAILAGSVGAICLPFIIPLWAKYRKTTIIGIAACLVMIITSASSGPILSAIAAISALVMFRHRHRLRLALGLLVAGYIILDLIMKDPAYFIMARIDLAGGSTGWHRARLIQSAIAHLSEWWLAGTNYTRDWMPTGVYWSGEHTDITNHYLQMGVWGGLPLMLLFIAILYKGFSFIGEALAQTPESLPEFRYMIWAVGSSLFAQAITFISVAFFDQSFVFLYLTLAVIGSYRSGMVSSIAYSIANPSNTSQATSSHS